MKRKLAFIGLFVFVTLIFTVYAFKRYVIVNMMGGDVDVTYLVVCEGYKPVYHLHEIDKLINPNPIPLSPTERDSIHSYINRRLKAANLITDNASLASLISKNSKYTHTYFMAYYPVDVFTMHFCLEGYKLFLEARREEGVLILPSDSEESRWIVSSCKASNE